MTAADRLERLTEQHEVVCGQLAQSMERIAELERKLDVKDRVMMAYFEIGAAALGEHKFSALATERIREIEHHPSSEEPT
jgi:hypothetical protein